MRGGHLREVVAKGGSTVLTLTLIQFMLTSYLRKDVKYIKVFTRLKVVIVLALFCDENLQSYNLIQKLSETFRQKISHGEC